MSRRKKTIVSIGIVGGLIIVLLAIAVALGSREQSADLTALQVVAALKQAGMPVGAVLVYDAATDPNDLVGQPYAYTEKVNFADEELANPSASDTDGTVEVFANADDAAKRKASMDAFSENAPTVGYLTYQQGRYLLRLSHRVQAARARRYREAFVTALESGAVPTPIATTAIPADKPTQAKVAPFFTAAFMKAKWLTPKERKYLVAVNDSWLSIQKTSNKYSALSGSDAQEARALELVQSLHGQASAWQGASSPSSRMLPIHQRTLALMNNLADMYRFLKTVYVTEDRPEIGRATEKVAQLGGALPELAGGVVQAAVKFAKKHEPKKSVSTPTPTPTPTPTVKPRPSYTVAKIENDSFGSTKRYEIHVVLPGSSTGSQRMQIARRVVEDLKDEKPFNAAGVFFWKKKSDIGKMPAAHSIDYAPGGDWSEADTVETGDYSSMEYTVQF